MVIVRLIDFWVGGLVSIRFTHLLLDLVVEYFCVWLVWFLTCFCFSWLILNDFERFLNDFWTIDWFELSIVWLFFFFMHACTPIDLSPFRSCSLATAKKVERYKEKNVEKVQGYRRHTEYTGKTMYPTNNGHPRAHARLYIYIFFFSSNNQQPSSKQE